MDDAEHQPGPALFKTAVGTAITALIGSIAVVVSLLVFVLNLLVTTEIGIGGLIISFVVCGVGLTTGLIVLRRLFPRREPISIFAGPIRLSVQAASRATVPAQTGGCLPDGLKSARPVHAIAQISPVMKTHGSESIATYNTHDVAGALGLVTIIGLGSGLATRFSDGWQFLSITAVAGCALALVLYWRQGSGVSEYRIPATGGVIGLIAIAGLGIIMMRFHALRYFFGLVVVSGGVIALLLRWLHRRGRSGSLIQLHVSPGGFSRTMPTE
jgi:hypothetical protein